MPRRHIKDRHFRARERFTERADDSRTHRLGEFIQPEMMIRPGDLLEEQPRIHNLEIIRPERARAHHSQVLVAQHDRVRRSPFVARERPRHHVIHIRLERRFEAIFPRRQLRQDRDVIRCEGVFAWPESIPVLPKVNELHHLAFAHDQLRPALDRFVVIRKPERECVARIIGPLDDFQRLCL